MYWHVLCPTVMTPGRWTEGWDGPASLLGVYTSDAIVLGIVVCLDDPAQPSLCKACAPVDIRYSSHA